MEANRTQAGTLNLLGGRLCLDFTNTVDWHASEHPVEFLTSYAALVAWSWHAGVLSNREAQTLLEEAEHRPTEANAVLERATTLREAMYRVFVSVIEGLRPDPSDVDTLNQAVSEAMVHLELAATADGFAWVWRAGEHALDRMLWQVARSAADMVASEARHWVKQCAGDPCGWLFLDTSKNHSRRWCNMGSCGNRAKSRRHYQRRRAIVTQP